MKKSRARVIALAITAILVWGAWRVMYWLVPSYPCGCATPCPFISFTTLEPLTYLALIIWVALDFTGWLK